MGGKIKKDFCMCISVFACVRDERKSRQRKTAFVCLSARKREGREGVSRANMETEQSRQTNRQKHQVGGGEGREPSDRIWEITPQCCRRFGGGRQSLDGMWWRG